MTWCLRDCYFSCLSACLPSKNSSWIDRELYFSCCHSPLSKMIQYHSSLLSLFVFPYLKGTFFFVFSRPSQSSLLPPRHSHSRLTVSVHNKPREKRYFGLHLLVLSSCFLCMPCRVDEAIEENEWILLDWWPVCSFMATVNDLSICVQLLTNRLAWMEREVKRHSFVFSRSRLKECY